MLLYPATWHGQSQYNSADLMVLKSFEPAILVRQDTGKFSAARMRHAGGGHPFAIGCGVK
jgi:hypothetical protein